MVLGERARFINDVAPYINGVYLQVEKTTGVNFGEPFVNDVLKNNSMSIDSTYPAIALCIVKENTPNQSMQYASELLKAFNRDGKSSNQIEIYRQSALKIGSEIAGFDDKMSDKKYLDKAKEDAKYSASESANGFPLLIIRNENKKGVLSNGCVSLEQIDAQLSQLF